jgi:uncharacterized protein (DUF111 family)
MLAKQVNKQLHQLETLNKDIEVMHSNIRNKWQQAQRVHNYQSEYDRVRSRMQNSATPDDTVQRIANRKTVLDRLGAQAFDFLR